MSCSKERGPFTAILELLSARAGPSHKPRTGAPSSPPGRAPFGGGRSRGSGVGDRLRGRERRLPGPCSGRAWGPRGPQRRGHHPFPRRPQPPSHREPRGRPDSPWGQAREIWGAGHGPGPVGPCHRPTHRDRTKNGSPLYFASGSVLFTTQPSPVAPTPTCSL